MSILLPKEQSYLFTTSNPGEGATVSADGSRLDISLDTPISVPAGAIDANVTILNANIWNTSFNISAAKNNNKFDYLIATVAQPQITIADGLYSLDTLNDTISREFVNAGVSATLIIFTGNNSTQRVIATFSIGTQIDGTIADSCIDTIMGFASAIIPAVNPIAIESEEAANVALFNETNSFAIQSNFVSQGIPVNNKGLNLLASIPITAGVGFQVRFAPQNPSLVDATELRGRSKSSFYFRVVNQDGTVLPQTETWSILMVLHYKLLITDENVPLLDM